MAGPEFTPVNLITGFLGAGKTTLLQRLLRQPALHDTAVLVNEFGQIGLDHVLLERIDATTVLLPSGCLCCTIQGELADALRSLHERRAQSRLPWFRRVVVETTGLADPFPLVATLHADPVLRHHFQLGQVLTVVDALFGAGQLDRHEPSVKQAAVADQLVVSKASLAGPQATAALVARLRGLNPQAPLHDAETDVMDAEALLCRGVFDAAGSPKAVQRSWPDERAPLDETGSGRYLGSRLPARHDPRVQAFSIVRAGPLDWTRFAIWLTLFVHRHGARLLRFKAILNVAGSATPVALHGVQHLVHAPVHLADWPDDERGSKLVFIVTGLDAATVERSLNACLR